MGHEGKNVACKAMRRKPSLHSSNKAGNKGRDTGTPELRADNRIAQNGVLCGIDGGMAGCKALRTRQLEVRDRSEEPRQVKRVCVTAEALKRHGILESRGNDGMRRGDEALWTPSIAPSSHGSALTGNAHFRRILISSHLSVLFFLLSRLE